jgi:hypothetical protein
MTTAVTSPHTLELPSFSTSGLTGREIQASERLRMAAVTEHGQDIVLHTKEGDTVTLSLERKTVAVYGRDARLSLQRYAAVDDGGRQAAVGDLAAESREWFGFEDRREFALSIEGDLNRNEVRDIRKALQRIHRLMDRTFGRVPGKAASRAGLAGLESLAGVEVRAQETRSLLATRSTSVTALTYGTDGQFTPGSEAPPVPEAPDWPTAAEEALGIVADTGVAPRAFVDPLRHLFNRWADEMHRQRRGFAPMVGMMAETVLDRLQITPLDGDAV